MRRPRSLTAQYSARYGELEPEREMPAQVYDHSKARTVVQIRVACVDGDGNSAQSLAKDTSSKRRCMYISGIVSGQNQVRITRVPTYLLDYLSFRES